MALVWDIETDNYLDKLTRIHCIATLDTETMQSRIYGPDEVEDGIKSLMAAEEIIGHNIINSRLKCLLLYGFIILITMILIYS